MAALPRRGEWWVLTRPLPSGDVLIWEFEIMEVETGENWRVRIQDRSGLKGWIPASEYLEKKWLRKMRRQPKKAKAKPAKKKKKKRRTRR